MKRGFVLKDLFCLKSNRIGLKNHLNQVSRLSNRSALLYSTKTQVPGTRGSSGTASIAEIRSNNWLKLSQLVKLDHRIPKFDTLMQSLSNDTRGTRRVGFLTAEKSKLLLSSLLIDPYHADQEWVNTFNNRYEPDKECHNNIHILKYNPFFTMHTVENNNRKTITFGVPSKYLSENNLEVIEYQSNKYLEYYQKDNALLYLNTDNTLSKRIEYPHLNIAEGNTAVEESTIAVSSELFFKELWDVYNDNNNNSKDEFSDFSQQYGKYGIQNMKTHLEKYLQNYNEAVIQPVEQLVLHIILLKDKDLNNRLFDKENDVKKLDYKTMINKWYIDSHSYLQRKIMNLPSCTLKQIYLYSEPRLELTLNKKISQSTPILSSLNYLKGELSIPLTAITTTKDSMTSGTNSKDVIDVELVSKTLHSQINKKVYSTFLKLQLPMVLISTVSVLTGIYTLETMIPICLFGIVYGVFKVSRECTKLWEKTLNKEMIGPIRNFIELENEKLINQTCLKNESLKSINTEKLLLIKKLYTF